MKLTRLKINRFRSVTPGTELHFGPGFNVILGKNGSGKTTLLDLVAAILNDNLSRYQKEEDGLDIEYTLQVGVATLDMSIQFRPASTSDSSLHPLLKAASLPSPFLSVSARSDQGSIFRCEVQGQRIRLAIGKSELKPIDIETEVGPRVLTVFLIPEVRGLDLLRPVFKELLTVRLFSSSERFDESLSAFHSLTESEVKITNKVWVETADFPLDLYKSIEPKREDNMGRVLRLDKLPVFFPLLPLLGFVGVDCSIDIASESKGGEEFVLSHPKVLFTRTSGDKLSMELLSFGQKRLFSFFWYLAVRNEQPAVLDELTNGLHHDWIEGCLEALEGRQAFLVTQNPLLLDHLPLIRGEDTVTYIRCTNPTPGAAEMTWTNFSEEEVEQVTSACEVGIQHVSEILRTQDLW